MTNKMRIEHMEIPIRELVNGYERDVNDDEKPVIGYGGLLDIRPAYQREFIYNTKEQEAVIDSIMKGFPINSMYWVKNEDGRYELLDGQQRTISICDFYKGWTSYKERGFGNFHEDEQERFLNYELQVYVCVDGDYTERIDWFNTINIPSKVLTKQEIRNANCVGRWLTDAKIFFSKKKAPAYNIGAKYLTGKRERQEILETALEWICDRDGISIMKYMYDHQHKPNCNELWSYFQNVISWVEATFKVYRKEMKGIEWGLLYNKYKDAELDPDVIEEKTSALFKDNEVGDKKGIYKYLLTGEEKYLNLRAFDENEKATMYELQQGLCANCRKHFKITEMEADHIVPWSRGGKTNLDNGQMLCRKCNNDKRDR